MMTIHTVASRSVVTISSRGRAYNHVKFICLAGMVVLGFGVGIGFGAKTFYRDTNSFNIGKW